MDVYLNLVFVVMLVETSGEIFQFPVGSIYGLDVGTRVRNVLLTEVVGISFMECVKQCLKTTKCQSVNYMARFHVCEMNYKNIGESASETISESSVIYTERQYWNQDKLLVGACSNTICSQNSRCIEGNVDNALCSVAACELPVDVTNATVDFNNGLGVYSQWTFTCDKGFYPVGYPRIACQDSGVWSPTQLQCEPVCTSGWIPFEASCYFLTTTAKSWTDAKRLCYQLGGYLVEIDSGDENEFLGKNAPVSTYYWTGGTDVAVHGTWRWATSNTLVTYTRWRSGQPDLGQSEDCIFYRSYSQDWDDAACNWALYYICEKTQLS